MVTWELYVLKYNKAAIWVRAMLAASNTEHARSALRFVALCARLIAPNCFISEERLDGSVKFGLYGDG